MGKGRRSGGWIMEDGRETGDGNLNLLRYEKWRMESGIEKLDGKLKIMRDGELHWDEEKG